MAHIYWELHEIPLPEDSYINRNDGRVFIMSRDGIQKKRRTVIGRATSETTMHPNDAYKYLYPSEWKKFYGENNLPKHELHIGMYALTLGIGYATELYPILQEIYGPLYGNAIIDYAMYAVMERTDATQLFPECMERQVLFSKETYSDMWYSELFRIRMSEDANHQFRYRWIKQCSERGTKKVWLSIDGSNNDCNVSQSDLPEPGKAKSHTNSDIVSYIWAVDAENGCPVTYNVNNGGMVDSKAFQKLVAMLDSADIGIEGIILDRAFCTHDVFEMLERCGFPFIILLKADTFGHLRMMERHAETIRWKVPYIINDEGIFGISETGKVFGNHPETAVINLFFDGSNGAARSLTLIRKIRKAAKTMQEQIDSGKKPSVPKDMSAYLSVKQSGDHWEVEYRYDAWQKAIDTKGFSSIASSENFGPSVVNRLYHLRDASEKQFLCLKSQLGFDVTRVHSTNGILNKFAVCFVSAILRNEIMLACQKLGLETNKMIRKIDRIALVLKMDGLYCSVYNQSGRQLDLLRYFGIRREDFKVLAEDVNRRMVNPINSQKHRLPSDLPAGQRRKPGRPPKKKEVPTTDSPKRGPGRPKGSKNKKTLEREALEKNMVKRKPGRPKGSKNKKSIDKEAKEQVDVKRGRGRPKGSKNKAKKDLNSKS